MADPTRARLIPPFLSKCYDMVDDPATDPTISWGSMGTTFVIWDVPTLEQHLLPSYYKHKNFSSFIRQLNVYGFKKNDPGRWEFSNEWFIKGQKQLLWNITRKKSTLGNGQQDQPQEINASVRKKSSQDCQQIQLQKNNTSIKRKSSQGNRGRSQLQENSTDTTRKSTQGNTQNESQKNITSGGACVEVGKFRLWEEVEILKKDKDVVMQEITKLGNHQQGADGKLHRLGQRLEGMEISQQQMMSFLAMVVQNPAFLGQFLQQNEGSWVISEIGKKRPYLALDQGAEYNELVASDGQMVAYQPLLNEAPKPLLTSSLNLSEQQFGSSSSDLSDFFESFDMMQSEEGMTMHMEGSGHGDENQAVVPYLLDNGILELEKLLLASPARDNVETHQPNSTGIVEGDMNLDLIDYNTTEEPSQTLVRLTKELGLLISETNNEDGNS